jgi:hypothetical protein
MCNIAFSQGIRDNYSVFSESAQFELYQHRLCSENFTSYQQFSDKSSGLGITIPLAEGLLGLSGSLDQKNGQFNQAYSKFCQNTFFTADSNSRYRSFVSQVSKNLVDTWGKCVGDYLDAWVKAKGVFVSVSPLSNLDMFVASVTVRSEMLNQTVIKDIHPEGQVTCTRANQPVKAAGMFVQMRPHASKVLDELGIDVHAQRDNTSGW